MKRYCAKICRWICIGCFNFNLLSLISTMMDCYLCY